MAAFGMYDDDGDDDDERGSDTCFPHMTMVSPPARSSNNKFQGEKRMR
jgi:hypothetical protein